MEIHPNVVQRSSVVSTPKAARIKSIARTLKIPDIGIIISGYRLISTKRSVVVHNIADPATIWIKGRINSGSNIEISKIPIRRDPAFSILTIDHGISKAGRILYICADAKPWAGWHKAASAGVCIRYPEIGDIGCGIVQYAGVIVS